MCLGGLLWKQMDMAGKQGRIPAPQSQGTEKCLPIGRGVSPTPPRWQEEMATDSVPWGY